MTVAQLNYLRTLEERRHNQAQEEIAREQQEVQKYVADTQATSSRYATDKSFIANTYAADTNAATQRYVSDRQYDTQNARLEFDRDTQSFKNQMATYQLKLDEISQGADTDLKRAQVKRITKELAIAAEDLRMRAERLGLDKEAQKYENMYKEAKTYESLATLGEKTANVVDKVLKWFKVVK